MNDMKMKIPLSTLAGVLTAIALVSCTKQSSSNSGHAENASSPDGIAWRRDLDVAKQEAKQSGKPILVDFFATWCGPCKKMDSQTWSDAEVSKQLDAWIPVKVDVDQHQELAASYKVKGVPTLVFLGPDGRLVSTFVGFAGPDEVLGLMKEARSQVKAANHSSASANQFAGNNNDEFDVGKDFAPANPDAEAASRVVASVNNKTPVVRNGLAKGTNQR